MKRKLTSVAIAAALFSSVTLYSHTTLDEVPDLRQFSRQVADSEHFSTYYLDQPIEVIDTHLHPGSYDKLGPKGKEFVKSVFPVNLPDAIKVPLLRFLSSFQLNPYGAFIGIKNECRRAAATHCILFATYAPETWGIEPNEDLIGYLDDNRNQVNDKTFFYGLASLSVADWQNQQEQSLDNLEQALAHPKVVGVKLAFAHTLTPFNAAEYHPIYQLAQEYNKPIYHHVGTSPLRKVSEFEEHQIPDVLKTFDPSFLDSAIAQFPEVKFIMGHAGNDANGEGYDKFDEVFALAEKYSNVYIEISALASNRSDPDGSKLDTLLLKAKALNLIDRIIYGSDGPGSPGNTKSYKERVLTSLERVGYTFAEAQSVMAGNARSVFAIP